MGQKVHPLGFRLGVTETWRSRWCADKGYKNYLQQDIKLREYVTEKLSNAGISSIHIDRPASKRVKIDVYTARPGLVIGKKGKEIEELRAKLKKTVGREVAVNIVEVKKPDLDAQLIAESIANQLERRVAFRRALRDGISKTMRSGAEGVKISIAGRLGGADIARTEWAREGQVPLHTLRADISYGTARAATTYGIIGIKCWIYTGDKVEEEEQE